MHADNTFTDIDIIRIWRFYLDKAEQRRVVEFFCQFCDTLRQEACGDKQIEVGLLDLIEVVAPFVVGLVPIAGQILDAVEVVRDLIDLYEDFSLPPLPECPRPEREPLLPRIPVRASVVPVEEAPPSPPRAIGAVPGPFERLIPLDLPPPRVPEPVPITRPAIPGGVSRETSQPRTRSGRFRPFGGGVGLLPPVTISVGPPETGPSGPPSISVGVGFGFSHTLPHLIEMIRETREDVIRERRKGGKKSPKFRPPPRRSKAKVGQVGAAKADPDSKRTRRT